MASPERETFQSEPRTYILFISAHCDCCFFASCTNILTYFSTPNNEYKVIFKLLILKNMFLAATLIGWTERLQSRT